MIKVGQRVKYRYWEAGEDHGHPTDWPMEGVGTVIVVRLQKILVEHKDLTRVWVETEDVLKVWDRRQKHG